MIQCLCCSAKHDSCLSIVCELINFVLCTQRGRDRSGVGLRAPYMRVVGITGAEDGKGSVGGVSGRITAQDEELFRELAQDPDVYNRIAKSIAPSIFGFEVM